MRRQTISGLSDLTGIDRRTIKKRLGAVSPMVEGAKSLYDTVEVLPLLFGKEDLDYQAERARLTHHQANKTELEEKELRGSLIRIDYVVELWATVASNIQSKMRGIPSQMVHRIMAEQDYTVALDMLTKKIDDDLKDLSDGELLINTDGLSKAEAGPSTKTDG